MARAEVSVLFGSRASPVDAAGAATLPPTARNAFTRPLP